MMINVEPTVFLSNYTPKSSKPDYHFNQPQLFENLLLLAVSGSMLARTEWSQSWSANSIFTVTKLAVQIVAAHGCGWARQSPTFYRTNAYGKFF